ncbi:MAG: MotA/TolQ/ExbB proton channel family protein [Planctomycetota bacterium]
MLRSINLRASRFQNGLPVQAALTFVAPLMLAAMAFAQDGEGAAEQKSPILEGLENAGIIGYIIILISVISFALVIENFISIKRDKLAPPGIIDDLEALFDEENYQEAMDVCESEQGYLTAIVGAGLQKLEFSYETIQAALREMQEEETVKLFQKIGWLSLIAASAPMMGLLGTVSGMFVTFGSIASAGGSVSPAQLAGGIKLALVTTILGLIVALPTGAFFFIFRNKVIRATIEVNAIAEDLFERFRGKKANA